MAGIAEFQARLSDYLDLVKSGEELVVTDRGRPVAAVNRIPAADGELDELVRNGVVRPPSAPLSGDFFDRPRPRDRAGSVVQALVEERRQGR